MACSVRCSATLKVTTVCSLRAPPKLRQECPRKGKTSCGSFQARVHRCRVASAARQSLANHASTMFGQSKDTCAVSLSELCTRSDGVGRGGHWMLARGVLMGKLARLSTATPWLAHLHFKRSF